MCETCETCALLRPVEFSLYLHVPFCLSKCEYCSFYSRPVDDSSVELWLAGISREARRLLRTWEGRLPLRTLYIGGGTPSILSPKAWKRLIHILEGAFDFSGLLEATVEANPCSLTVEHSALWRDSFVTRVSVGVQSLDDEELLWLGRRHDARTALRAIDMALSRGFEVSADLIFGHPRQTLRSWHDTLRGIVATGIGHISTYQLTLEPDTPLGGKNPELPEGYSFYRFAQWYLSRKGLSQYEVASFARPGRECLHNLAYWRQENVLALGPAAWGYLSTNGFRYRNASTLEEYLRLTKNAFPVVETECLDNRARGVEAAILALRTKWGIEINYFVERFGHSLWTEILEILAGLPKRLVRVEERRVYLTPSGMRIGNAIWTELLGLSE